LRQTGVNEKITVFLKVHNICQRLQLLLVAPGVKKPPQPPVGTLMVVSRVTCYYKISERDPWDRIHLRTPFIQNVGTYHYVIGS
jgi:hypothetical protein